MLAQRRVPPWTRTWSSLRNITQVSRTPGMKANIGESVLRSQMGVELYKFADAFVGGFACFVAAVIHGDKEREVFFGGDPHVAIPTGVAAGVSESESAGPGTFGDEPAAGVTLLRHRRGEFLECLGGDERRMALRAAHHLGDELGPIADGAMNGSRRAERREVIKLLGAELPISRCMAPGLVNLAGSSRRAESSRGHVQRAEDFPPDDFFPRLACLGLDDCAEKKEADIGIDVLSDGSRRRNGQGLLDAKAALRRKRKMGGSQGAPIDVVRKTGGVIEQIAHGVVRHLRIHFRRQIGEKFPDGAIEREFLFVNELADENGGHGLGIRAKVNCVGGKKRRGVADFANTRAAQRHDLTAMNDRPNDARQLVFFRERAKRRGEIARRGGSVGRKKKSEWRHKSELDKKSFFDHAHSGPMLVGVEKGVKWQVWLVRKSNVGRGELRRARN